jgi:hypothetical protein
VGHARQHHDAVDSTAIVKLSLPGLDADALAAELFAIGEETGDFQAAALGKVLGIQLDDIRLAQWSAGARPAIDEWVQENAERITTVYSGGFPPYCATASTRNGESVVSPISLATPFKQFSTSIDVGYSMALSPRCRCRCRCIGT